VATEPYRLLIGDLRKRQPALADVEFPQLVIVDGNLATARYVEAGDDRYVVLSRGLEATAIRLARYCIAWLVPGSISYMDNWPTSKENAALRFALEEELVGFARSGGDISGLGRIQVTGLRDLQAHYLLITFVAFALSHELSHFLRMRDGAWANRSPRDHELQADVDAAQALPEHDIDGDREMVEALRDTDPELARRMLRLMESRQGFRDEFPDDISDADLKLILEAAPEVASRFADCDWNAAAVAAFILIVGGSVGYGNGIDLVGRAMHVVREAFGEESASEVERELAGPDSVLSMLRNVFAPHGTTP
jgi:hypothetical protein